MEKYSLKLGQHTGREHIFYDRNNQDALRHIEIDIKGKKYLIVYICDGCTAGRYNEAGANMAADFLLRQTIDLLEGDIPLELTPYFLHEDLLSFLRTILHAQHFKNPSEESRYINDHLLFSIVGLILTENSGLVLAQGDGLVIINDDIYFRDYNDLAPYIGYLLVNQKYLDPNHSLINEEFDVYNFDVTTLKKLAIGSDSWLQEKELLEKIWGHKHPNQIQRLLNIWSDRDKRLRDDTTIAIVEEDQGG